MTIDDLLDSCGPGGRTDVPAGSPDAGEDACPRGGGSGRLGGRSCPGCQASGKVNVGIGGA